MPVAAKTAILVTSLLQKQWLENISKRVVQINFIYHSPSNSLQINASFRDNFQKCDSYRQHFSCK